MLTSIDFGGAVAEGVAAGGLPWGMVFGVVGVLALLSLMAVSLMWREGEG